MLWQLSSAAAASSPEHLRYQSELDLPASASGQACVALDAAVFAHTEALGAGDVRIYGREGQREFEVPFAMTESGPATLEAQNATAGNVSVRSGEVVFDLSMPAGGYTEVDLQLNANNFVGTAQVAGIGSQGRVTPLGTFAVFDLRADGLARSTVLALPRSSYPVLRIQLRLRDARGWPIAPSPSSVSGAVVPPEGEEQTAYTTIASSTAIQQQGHWSTATMVVPAHVPIERARFVLQPEFRGDFLRDATVAAAPLESGLAALGAAEGVSGHIFRVTRSATDGVPAIDSQVLTIDTVLGANLRSAARVTTSIDNGSAAPLPLQRVDLEMRERRLCFAARPGVRYTLRYGDAELSAPSYAYARRFVAAERPVLAALGPEQRNLHYVQDGAGNEQRSGRELPWVLLIAGIAVAGVIGLQYVRHRREEMG